MDHGTQVRTGFETYFNVCGELLVLNVSASTVAASADSSSKLSNEKDKHNVDVITTDRKIPFEKHHYQ